LTKKEKTFSFREGPHRGKKPISLGGEKKSAIQQGGAERAATVKNYGSGQGASHRQKGKGGIVLGRGNGGTAKLKKKHLTKPEKRGGEKKKFSIQRQREPTKHVLGGRKGGGLET